MTVPRMAADVIEMQDELDVLLDLVQQLLRLGSGGYTTPEHQATRRAARAVLADHGRAA